MFGSEIKLVGASQEWTVLHVWVAHQKTSNDVVEAKSCHLCLFHLFFSRLWFYLLSSQHLYEVERALHAALVFHEFNAFFLHIL